jgi:hypothetical protein
MMIYIIYLWLISMVNIIWYMWDGIYDHIHPGIGLMVDVWLIINH